MAVKMFISVKLLFLFLGIGLSTPMDPKSINIAVESSFYLDPKDVEKNSSLLDRVKHFIDNLQTAINPQQNYRRSQKDVLTEFLTELGILVINFDDNEFSILANDLKDVVESKSKTPEFNEVFKDDIFKLYLKLTLKEWTETDPTKLKLEIARYVTNTETTAFVTFFRNLNKYYRESDERELKEIVQEFKEAKREKSFKNVLNKAIEFIVFDKFKKADNEFLISINNDFKELVAHVTGIVKDSPFFNVRANEETNVEKQATTEAKELNEDVPKILVNNDLKDNTDA